MTNFGAACAPLFFLSIASVLAGCGEAASDPGNHGGTGATGHASTSADASSAPQSSATDGSDGGGTCFQPPPYETTCTTSADCIAAPAPPICPGECNCHFVPANTSDSWVFGMLGNCGECGLDVVRCVAGQCTDCSAPGACPSAGANDGGASGVGD